MAIGLPVIASACSGTVDVVRDGIDGRLFPIGDRKALICLLQELLQDPIQRTRLSQEARTISDRFNEATIFQLWEDLLHSLA
jgi:glycosyltransferase involved in cell wall biosynthesis